MTTLPNLPEPAMRLPEGKYTFQVEAQHIHREPFYTKAQMLEYGRQTVEACAAIVVMLTVGAVLWGVLR